MKTESSYPIFTENTDQEIELIMLTKSEAAIYLSVSLSTLNRIIARGDLRVARFGRSVRLSEEALAEFIFRSEVN